MPARYLLCTYIQIHTDIQTDQERDRERWKERPKRHNSPLILEAVMRGVSKSGFGGDWLEGSSCNPHVQVQFLARVYIHINTSTSAKLCTSGPFGFVSFQVCLETPIFQKCPATETPGSLVVPQGCEPRSSFRKLAICFRSQCSKSQAHLPCSFECINFFKRGATCTKMWNPMHSWQYLG